MTPPDGYCFRLRESFADLERPRMKHEKFKKLVERDSALLRDAPAAYGRRLALLAFAGLAYTYLVAFVCLACSAAAFYAAFKLQSALMTFPAILLLVVVIRLYFSLAFAFAPPDGVELKRGDVPELFKEVDELSRAMKAKTPDSIILNLDMNAGACVIPGRHPFAKAKSYLILGYPLMAALPRKEFRSVVAHEMGHFSLAHPTNSRLAWRSLQTWGRVKAFLSAGGDFLSRPLLGLFADFYLPRLEAALSVRSRSDEREADALESAFVGRETSARALLLHVRQSKRIVEGVTRPFWEKARLAPEPPKGFVDALRSFLERAPYPDEESLKSLFEKAKAMRSISDDSHPSLGERLARMGAADTPPTLFFSGPSAAKELLGDFEEKPLPLLDERWRRGVANEWTFAHLESQTARRALSSMVSGVAAGAEIPLETLLARARLLEMAFGPDSAVRPLEDVLEAHPDNLEAKFNLGRVLLRLEKDGADLMMLDAMKADARFIPLGADLLASHYRVEGQADKYAAVMAMKEGVPALDAFDLKKGLPAPKPDYALPKAAKIASHDVKPAELEEILASVEENGNVARAYLVRVIPRDASSGETPFLALFVVRKFSLLAYRGEDDFALAKELAAPLSRHKALRVIPFDACPALLKIKVRLTRDFIVYKS